MKGNLSDILPPSRGETILPCQIRVDEEGDWYHQGSLIFREDILELFYANLHLSRENGFLIRWRGTQCTLDVADTPFVVTRADRKRSESGEEGIFLTFKHLRESELLDPSTLCVGRENILYCRIRGGIFTARFSRPAYYQMAEWIGEDAQSGDFYLELGGSRHLIRSVFED